MARFDVQITEFVEDREPPRPQDPTPEVRSVFWSGEADDEGAAREAGYVTWDGKYGPGRQPVQALVNVTPLAG
ncbi:MAG TPA: hypothetical protein VHT27_04605 [Solirubrobacteraceae bacterium]|jgi:hypothetical protein|nr:hypothetical protein [Solirubrobacteraceae bacterium]